MVSVVGGIRGYVCCFTSGFENSEKFLFDEVKVKVNQSHYRPEVPRGFQEVKVPGLHNIGPGWW